MLKNIDEHLKILVKDKNNKSKILEDIHYLQLNKNKEVFETASNLFIEKLTEEANGFCSYFREQGLVRNSNLFEGVLRNVPKINNAFVDRRTDNERTTY